ncbi:hypothetical protein [Chryseobacterium herbae]|uniref:Uncharacterized protein n=1 Tax=Chryseobacterium herbae TaxID=2976476 RepID=A0ABT2IYL6_9FLAO|nr:hypothetical protein [Chryseobacterium sp. pc1-10]MCT2563939.1 hypothetical protein [Chryseobacterium sp. pc1-10]
MAKISKLNLRQLFARGLKPAQEAFYNFFDSFWHKDELIEIASVKNLQSELSNKLDTGAKDTLIAAFDQAVENMTELAQSAYKGIAEASTTPPAIGVFWYRVEDGNSTTFTHFLNSSGVAIQTVATDFKDVNDNYYDVSLEINDNIAKKVKKLRPAVGFSENEFNSLAEDLGEIKVSLISKNLADVNLPSSVASGIGTSIFTMQLNSPQKIRLLRIKVATTGLGKFTCRRGTSTLTIKSDVPLNAGWNNVTVDFEALSSDYIGYSTLNSTSDLTYTDAGNGTYYTVNGSNQIVEHPGNIGLEVFNGIYDGNKFKDIIGIKPVGTNDFNRLKRLSKPVLQESDHGVVSVFNLPATEDLMSNNKINVNGSVSGNFSINEGYNFSLGFIVRFPNKYTSNKNISIINCGSFALTIYAGTSGIGVFKDGESNGIAYDYGNKDVYFVVKGNAYFIAIWVDGREIGFFNKGKKVSSINCNFPVPDNQVLKNITLWDREISKERLTDWMASLNPFKLSSPQDKFFPAQGIQMSNHLLEGNTKFFIPGEQTVVKFKGKYFMYFTAANGTPDVFIEAGIAVAISGRPDGGFMMHSNYVVIGGLEHAEHNTAGVPSAMAAWAGVVNDYVYVFAAMDYNSPSEGGKIFKSSDGVNFTFVRNITTEEGDIPYLANVGMCTTKVDGFYYGIIEGKLSGSAPWSLFLVKSENFEGPYTVVQNLPSLNIFGSSGGPDLMRSVNDDRWICVYHACHNTSGTAFAPTDIFYAECKDLEPINWIKKGRVLAINDELEYYNAFNCDQVATPGIIEENGVTYMNYVLAQNSPTLHCQIRSVKFNGTKEELFGLVPD